MKDIKTHLEKYLTKLDTKGYLNGAILVSYKDEIIHSKGYGIANHPFDIKNTDETKFRIGSLTKAFTAMAILQLEEKGLVKIEDTLDNYLEDFSEAKKITIHHLLTHSSGIPDFAGDESYWPNRMRLYTTLENTIDIFTKRPLLFEPGTKFRYSNTEYAILAYIIGKVSGVDYERYIEDHILTPLGLSHTGFDDGRKIIKNLANGYTVWKDIINPEFVDMTNAKGAYDMYSNVGDLYRWGKALETEKLVSENQIKKMFSLHNSCSGYGWFLDEHRINGMQRKRAYHFGDVNGFANYFCKYFEEELIVIVLSNFNLTPVDQISKNIARIVLGEGVESTDDFTGVDVDIAEMDVYVGEYGMDGGSIFVVREGERLFIRMPKMYGAVYMYELVPVYVDRGKVEFKTRMIEETVVIEVNGGEGSRLMHRDFYGREVWGVKVGGGLGRYDEA